VAAKLDPQCKGYAELDELVELISHKLQDPYQSMLKQYVTSGCEYKNTEKVYYSGVLGGVLPPFFKYAKRFDSFSVIEKFNKELQSIDTHGTGFVPINLFRSVLEHELKIKEKIVLDFLHNLRETDSVSQQLLTLDVNLFSHSLRSQVDYTIMLRKLAQYFEIKESQMPIENKIRQGASAESLSGEEVVLRIDIESAMRLKNPWNDLDAPSTFVVLKLPYQGCQPQKIQTQTVFKSSYPAWHLINQQARFVLTNENLRHIIEYPLEFEVYITQPVSNKETASSQLLGVAYVDLA
jgi:C2 domain